MTTSTISLRAYGYKLANSVEDRRKSLKAAIKATNCVSVLARLQSIKRFQTKNEIIINHDIIFCILCFQEQNEVMLQNWHRVMCNTASTIDDANMIRF
jgi:hypothetical protein